MNTLQVNDHFFVKFERTQSYIPYTLFESIDSTTIKFLHLSGGCYETIPSEIGNLSYLEGIHIQCDTLKTFPDSIYQLKNLKSLSLLGVDEIPTQVFHLSSLESLTIIFTLIKEIPSNIEELIHLKELDLSSNRIENLPDCIKTMTSLRTIKLLDNPIKEFPLSLCSLIKLRLLDLSHCKIRSIPKEIYSLRNLTLLDLSHNQLSSLPREIGMLTSLTLLKLNSNHLSSLPSSLRNVNSLERIELEENNISDLPLLYELPRVTFTLYNNPITFRPSEEKNIYQDSENVHDRTVQHSLRSSLQKLLQSTPLKNIVSLEDILNEVEDRPHLSDEIKDIIYEWCQELTETFVEHQLTYSDVFRLIWSRISSHKEKESLLSILSYELNDSVDKCFVGKMARLVNVINGYDNDVEIHISEKEQLCQILIQTKKQIIPYNVDRHKELVYKELESRDYPKKTIDEWISFIS